MKKQSKLGLLLATICLLTGCVYESSFDLAGQPVKYNKLVIGNFYSDGSALNISRIDDYKIKISYESDVLDVELKNAVGKFVRNGNNQYVVVKHDGKYLVGRILAINREALEVNLLDTDEDELGDSKIFKSAREFSQFVFNNRTIFSEEYNETFTRY